VAIIAGLLHDIGKLFLASKMPSEYGAVASRVSKLGCEWYEAEEAFLGTSHSEIGAYLLGLWGIPELAVEAIAYHHYPNRDPHTGFVCVEALYMADLLAHEIEAKRIGSCGMEIEEKDQLILEQFGLMAQLQEFRRLATRAFAHG
jgi:HD-like signal output (HDOD) protein